MIKWVCKCGKEYKTKYQAKLCHYDYVRVDDAGEAQQNAHLTPESLASSQAVSNTSALSKSDGDTPPAQSQVA